MAKKSPPRSKTPPAKAKPGANAITPGPLKGGSFAPAKGFVPFGKKKDGK